MPPHLVLLAAGRSSRFGGLKQLAPVGPAGEAILDFSIFDAARAGFDGVVVVTGPELSTPFREHLAALLGGALPFVVAVQEADSSAGRAKPWGTGHAVLAARGALRGPFVVANADDFYGASGYRRMASHLTRHQSAGDHALLSYRLDQTSIPDGSGVSRALCRSGPDGYLRALDEVHDVRAADAGYVGVGPDGGILSLPADATVSVNLWGFTPDVFPILTRAFAVFRDDHPDPDQEFYLGDGVARAVAAGSMRVKLLAADEPMFGITHPEDHPAARDAVRRLVDGGRYPPDLAQWFRSRA